MASYKEIYKTIGIFGGVQAITILLNLVRTKLAAILIGTFGAGLNSIYFESRELLHISTNLGIDVSAIRNISLSFEAWKNAEMKDRDELWQKLAVSVRLVRSLALMLAVIGVVAMLVFALPLSYFMFMNVEHTIDFIVLAPAVGFTTLICSEMAVLKALRKIKTMAMVSILNIVMAIVTSAPIFYFYGVSGVLPAILVFFFFEFVIVAFFSYRTVKPSFCINGETIKQGMPILKLGVALTLAGAALRLSQLAIRSFINNEGGTDMVGLYNSGYTILMLVGGLVFSSIETDYYPRLSGSFNDIKERRRIVHRQIKATLSLMIPIVVVFVVLLPWIVPLLLSHDFDPVVPMVQTASLSMIFRAATQPYGYVPIAAGNPKLHMILETYCDILIFIAVAVGFVQCGLIGAGIGYTVANAIDMVVLWIVMRWKYGV